MTRRRPTIGRSTNPLMIAGRSMITGYGMATAARRPLPDFLIIGAKRGGTTSLYFDLLSHPQVCPLFPAPQRLPKAAPTKGIHYFDQNYWRGDRWYRAHLPSAWVRRRHDGGAAVIVGEASPYYLFHPGAAARAASTMPAAKIIVMLRDPVQRTYSQWKERRRNDAEPLDFAAALAAEDTRIAAEGATEERLRADPKFYSYAHEQLSYARQSEYGPALERWYAEFPPEQILPIASEDYYGDPKAVLTTVQRFLGVAPRDLGSGEVLNSAAGAALDPAVAEQLAARFAESNATVRALTGRAYAWA